jgi:translation initiation factor IF-2
MSAKEVKKDGNLRSPIVAILGHVDHGKTTLLDAVRKTDVAKKEAGGITQSIGASVVTTKTGKKITFIDTPGHAAFANMRSQGAKVADIAVLVVAADDGVKPQTKEALEYILQANIPFIVAATKTDLSSSSVEAVRNQLEKEKIAFEGRGGDVPLVNVSATKVHEVGKMGSEFEAVVIETGKDKRGPHVSALIRGGSLGVGDLVVTEKTSAKIRALFNSRGESVRSIDAGEPVQILGFSDLPLVGSKMWHKKADAQVSVKQENHKIQEKVEEGEIPVVIKAKTAGGLEAVVKNLPEKTVVISSSVGEVIEADVFIAKSSGASIYAFESKVGSEARRLAENEGVQISTFSIIYELLEEVEKALHKDDVEILGKAKVLQAFPFNNKKVAGCEVTEGTISKVDTLLLTRADTQLGETKISSFKKGKETIEKAGQGEQCGIIFASRLEFKPGDMVISVRK